MNSPLSGRKLAQTFPLSSTRAVDWRVLLGDEECDRLIAEAYQSVADRSHTDLGTPPVKKSASGRFVSVKRAAIPTFETFKELSGKRI